ncbi:MAG: polysaccharide deacetylase family protein [bacterium]|nr:polysaccharide deacetylase family protein [bacterium]
MRFIPNKKKSKKRSRKKKFPFDLILLCSIFAIILILLHFQFKPIFEKKADLTAIPLEKQLKPDSSFRIPILLYHYVEHVQDKGDTIRQSLNIFPNVFEEQVKTLSENGYTFMTASELADVLDGKKSLPQKPILLTFDDGHWDLFTDILPILEKYHAKATAYIISGFIGGSDFLTDDQMKKVVQSRLIEIGAHTVHHVGLAYKLLTLVQFEVASSKKQLEDTYHIRVGSFAYPGGSFDQQAANVVKNAGFRTAVSTIPGIQQNQSNRFFLHRIRPGYRVGDELLEYLKQENFRPW